MWQGARALLRWDQKQLAATAGISMETVKRLEKTPGKVSAYTGTMELEAMAPRHDTAARR